MKKQIAIAVTALVLVPAAQIEAQVSNQKTLECEVLEVSNDYRGDQKELGMIGYAIVRHKNPGDRKQLSAWLRAKSGASVIFITADGTHRQGVLRRLRMCFGRGLLIFTGPLKLKERESITVELSD